MPPLSAQDALSAVQRGAGWRWLDLPVALADVASEPWVVALLALALFAWLEYEVKDVVKAFLPLGVALLAAAAVALAAQALGAVPRPVGQGGPGATSLLLWRAFPASNVGAVAAFAAYALLAYGRRARVALVLAAAVAVAGPSPVRTGSPTCSAGRRRGRRSARARTRSRCGCGRTATSRGCEVPGGGPRTRGKRWRNALPLDTWSKLA
jgi:hypothetical protein